MQNILLKRLEESVTKHDDDMMHQAINDALNVGMQLFDIRRFLMLGLEKVRHKLGSNDASIPDFLLCVDTMTEGLDRLAFLEKKHKAEQGGIPLIIGVVEGDPHDLGKNIIAAIYRTAMYQVFDLGCDVPNKTFIESVMKNEARVLALSAMMSTTTIAIPEIIREVKTKSPDTIIMVGGAFLEENLARSFGADGYAENAVTVLEETEAAILRVSEGKPWKSSN